MFKNTQERSVKLVGLAYFSKNRKKLFRSAARRVRKLMNQESRKGKKSHTGRSLDDVEEWINKLYTKSNREYHHHLEYSKMRLVSPE